MILSEKWREYEAQRQRDEGIDFEANLLIQRALYDEAVLLGVFPLKNPLEGLDDALEIAKVINGVRKTS